MTGSLVTIGGTLEMLVTASSEKPSLVEPARVLLLKLNVKEAGFGAWSTIMPKLRVSPAQLKAPSSRESCALPTSV